jgi:predicted permease
MHAPRPVPRWRRYVRFWRTDVKADVEDEFAFHIGERVDDLIAAGVDPHAAREEALARFGDLEQVKNACQSIAQDQESQMRRSELLGIVRQDAVYALRMMRGSAAFTIAVVFTLAIGIGATTAIFSVVNAVLLRPLPYADPERMAMVFERVNGGRGRASPGHFHDWSGLSNVFQATAAFSGRTYTLTDGEPMRVFGARVTPGFFQTGYMPPYLGRYFTPGEDEAHVVVLTYGLWRTRFAGDPAIVGKTITLNAEKYVVVGVTPAAYSLTPQDERLWTPLSFTPQQRDTYGAHNLQVFAKLKKGVTFAQAQRELERVTADIRRRYPDEMKGRDVEIAAFTDVLMGDYRTQLWVLLGAVTFVLLIGCSNIASLLLARAIARRKEIAIRGALGGSRRRLVSQLLTESLMLALAGGLAGLFLARFGVRFLVGAAPTFVPRLGEAGLDSSVLAFAVVATVVCGLVFGLAPALRATRVDLQSELREGGRGSTGIVRDRTRAALIVTEFAVALVLLVSAGLFLRSADRLQRVPLGFEPANVTMLRVSLPADRYRDSTAVEAAFSSIVEGIRAIPGVERAGASTRVPMWGGSIDMGVSVDGRPRNPGSRDFGHVRLVTAGFLETIGVPLKRGRLLDESDLREGAPRVVVVNETFARQIFGNESPIGHRISGWTKAEAPEWREIVGVIGDMRSFGRDADAQPEIYMPMTQRPGGAWDAFQRSMAIVAKTRPGLNVVGSLRGAVNRVDRQLALYDVQPMTEVLAQANATRRFNTILLSLLGATGLVLAAIGIYGVIAFFVTQRTHEIGVRVALGATTASVVRLVVRQAVTLALFGIALGAVSAFWATRVLGSMLFAVSARDPVAYGVAGAALLLVAIGAAWFPARRATRVDPVRALAAGG